MTSCDEVTAWFEDAVDTFGDPAVPVCQLFFRWQDLVIGSSEDLVCHMAGPDLALVLGPVFPPVPVRVRKGDPQLTAAEVEIYGLTSITSGVWALSPSLNVPGLIHAFVVIHGVPDPAPWERLIVLP